MALKLKQRWTAKSFLAFEAESEVKHELIDGEVYAMAGSSLEHSEISANITISIGSQLSNSSCRVLTSDMMVKADDEHYFYPDVSVVCGRPALEAGGRRVLLNPILIVEVTSPSSRHHDRGRKREYYQRIPSVQAILIIDQQRVYVEYYRRCDAGWTRQVFTRLDDVIRLDMLNCTLPLAQIYRSIGF